MEREFEQNEFPSMKHEYSKEGKDMYEFPKRDASGKYYSYYKTDTNGIKVRCSYLESDQVNNQLEGYERSRKNNDHI